MQFEQDKAFKGPMTDMPQQENPLYSLMRSYVQAKEAFDVACHEFNRAQETRSKCEAILRELSEKVAQVITQGVNDPTMPQAQAPMNTANSIYGGALQQGLGRPGY